VSLGSTFLKEAGGMPRFFLTEIRKIGTNGWGEIVSR